MNDTNIDGVVNTEDIVTIVTEVFVCTERFGCVVVVKLYN